jgi:hypothetical protein
MFVKAYYCLEQPEDQLRAILASPSFEESNSGTHFFKDLFAIPTFETTYPILHSLAQKGHLAGFGVRALRHFAGDSGTQLMTAVSLRLRSQHGIIVS